MTNLELARMFHEAYERMAPLFGYETRPETRVFDPESPNGELMLAVVNEVRNHVLGELEAAEQHVKILQEQRATAEPPPLSLWDIVPPHLHGPASYSFDEPPAPQAAAHWESLEPKYLPAAASRFGYMPWQSPWEHVPDGAPEEAGYIYGRVVVAGIDGKSIELRMRRVDRDAENREAKP